MVRPSVTGGLHRHIPKETGTQTIRMLHSLRSSSSASAIWMSSNPISAAIPSSVSTSLSPLGLRLRRLEVVRPSGEEEEEAVATGPSIFFDSSSLSRWCCASMATIYTKDKK